jgi:hypothetical protein
MLVGNLLGGLLVWGYFHFVDVTALSNHRRPGELAFFAISFALLGAVGLWIGRRWGRTLLEWARSRSSADEARVRRLALTFPYAMAGLTLTGWTLAGVAWGVVWPLLTGEFSARQAIRSFFAVSVIAPTSAAVRTSGLTKFNRFIKSHTATTRIKKGTIRAWTTPDNEREILRNAGLGNHRRRTRGKCGAEGKLPTMRELRRRSARWRQTGGLNLDVKIRGPFESEPTEYRWSCYNVRYRNADMRGR